jgi:hypothetical protein
MMTVCFTGGPLDGRACQISRALPRLYVPPVPGKDVSPLTRSGSPYLAGLKPYGNGRHVYELGDELSSYLYKGIEW